MLIGFYKLHHGQPIIVGHYSEKKHRRLIDRALSDIRKSIEEDDKSKYYADKAETVENNKAIYNDDPNAIEKLKDKLTYGKTKLEAGQYAKPGAGCDGECH